MMRLLIAIALAAFLCGCSVFQKTATFTSNDLASAAEIAAAAGLSQDANCLSAYHAVLAVTEDQLSQGNGGIASTTEVQRAFKSVSARPECSGITIEWLAVLGKIPYAGSFASQVFGF